jgi:hypothetical protein
MRHLKYSSETPTFYQNDFATRNTADETGGKPIAVWSQSISGVSAVNLLVAFYNIYGRNGKVLFFIKSRILHETNISLVIILTSTLNKLMEMLWFIRISYCFKIWLLYRNAYVIIKVWFHTSFSLDDKYFWEIVSPGRRKTSDRVFTLEIECMH